MLIYKILLPEEWEAFQRSGRFDGSPFDKESGFVHCSSRIQVAATARRSFKDVPEFVVLAVDADRIGDQVRVEPASSGELFPHVYGAIPRSAVIEAHRVAGAPRVEETLGLR